MKKSFIIAMIISLVSLVLALWFILTTEGQVPTNWGLNGEVNSYGSPWYMIIFPTITFFTTLLLYILPKIDPKGDNIRSSGPMLPVITVSVALLMLGIQFFTIWATHGGAIMNINTFVSIALSIMFIAMGYYTPRVKHNYMVGIRTPWTLYSETVWTKTHEEAGKWIILCGVLYLVGIPFPNPVDIIIPTIVTVIIFIGLTWYSYLLYSEEQEAIEAAKKVTKKKKK